MNPNTLTPYIEPARLRQLQEVWTQHFGGELYVMSQPQQVLNHVNTRVELLHAPGFWLVGTINDSTHHDKAKALLESWADLLVVGLHDKEKARLLTDELVTAWDRLSFLHKSARLMRNSSNLTTMSLQLLRLAVQTMAMDNAFLAQSGYSTQMTFHWLVPGRYSNVTEDNIINALNLKQTLVQCSTARECYETFRSHDMGSFIGRQLGYDDAQIYVGVISHADERNFNAGDVQIFESLIEQITTIVEINALHSKQMEVEDLRRELEIAAEVQKSFLPHQLPRLPEYEFHPELIPAAKVGGDFYDIYELGSNYGLLICDVVGKGISAALLASEIRTAIRAQMRYKHDPGQILREVNHTLYGDLASLDRFATVMLLYISADSNEWHYASAGHTTGLHLKAHDMSIERLESTTFPLGFFEEIASDYRSIEMDEGDVLVLYSDGLTEVEDEAGDILGMGGVIETLIATSEANADFIAERLLYTQGQHRWAHAVDDDLTLIVIKRKAAKPVKPAQHFFHWRVSSELSRLSQVNKDLSRLRAKLPKTPAMEEWYFELDLAVTELVSNVMRHSYPETNGFITGTLALYDDCVKFDMYDRGSPYEGTLDIGELDYDPLEPPIGGYGLYIIKQIIDELTYTRRPDGYNHWHFIRRLPNPSGV